MELKHIKKTTCPNCGCSIIKSEEVDTERGSTKIRKHVNGERWEYRTFACGERLKYIPNHSSVEVGGFCTKSKEYIEKKKKREDAKTKLIEFVRTLDIDDEFKTNLCFQLGF